ncbi:hypothetical protein K402DRAFT_247362 [Aulographum hederae CBS 113979]|uniref:Zn(2)-C6 fungal-type domain-containing protein n=1 Tax=Aulographum hederae CBS 113979 TaxID=1176131 RepID=A0A6G1HAM4_9PEZI|nr:hypothetical protein K402DRAFT_247362 [Aulographum hederae CBS 113979]
MDDNGHYNHPDDAPRLGASHEERATTTTTTQIPWLETLDDANVSDFDVLGIFNSEDINTWWLNPALEYGTDVGALLQGTTPNEHVRPSGPPLGESVDDFSFTNFASLPEWQDPPLQQPPEHTLSLLPGFCPPGGEMIPASRPFGQNIPLFHDPSSDSDDRSNTMSLSRDDPFPQLVDPQALLLPPSEQPGNMHASNSCAPSLQTSVPPTADIHDICSNIVGPGVTVLPTHEALHASNFMPRRTDSPSRQLPPFEHHADYAGSSSRQSATIARAKEKMPKRTLKPASAPFTFESSMGKFHTGRSRKSFAKDRKLQVADTRKRGACFRCKVSKITCLQVGGLGVCQKCVSRGASLHGLCFKLDLSDCSFFRTSSFVQPEGLRSDIDWAGSGTVTLSLGMANVPGGPSLQIACRHFRPIVSDMTADYARGEEIGALVQIPTYAAVDLTAIEEEVRSKARPFGLAYLAVMENEKTSPTVLHVLRGAFAYANAHPHSMVSTALDLWSGSRMCALDRSLNGNQTLGQAKIHDPLSPLFDQYPIPPILDLQCDTVTIKWMRRLANGLLKHLWRKVERKLSRKKVDSTNYEEWFEMFLTVFIMVNNIEYVYGIAKDLAFQYMRNAEELAPRVRKISLEWLNQWRWSAQHLLFIYKTYFNRGYPFSDRSLLDVCNQLDEDESIKTLVAYLVHHHGSLGGGEQESKAETDFNYEMYWNRELFQEN